ncbi:MBL fold metallo-hydrolase (plasmid) [Salipiger sp. H15]|uniref:MBL fold metallo-hydrolase n=1 Tax=Alloyangia sp. H15 TaxID=3029062 RepID=A0AAU8ARW4_9RHOB
MAGYEILLSGFPGSISRGYLGWSTVSLLHTPEGPVLFDTGAHNDRPGLMAALRERGLDPEEIAAILPSHLHFDHIANAECFPNARLLLHEDLLDAFERYGPQDPAMPIFLVRQMLGAMPVAMLRDEPELWPGVRILRTPGHCEGHISLLLDRGEARTVLAQDAVKHRGELASGVSDMARDPVAARASIRRIRDLAEVVVPGHDVPLRVAKDELEPLAPLRSSVTCTINGSSMELTL